MAYIVTGGRGLPLWSRTLLRTCSQVLTQGANGRTDKVGGLLGSYGAGAPSGAWTLNVVIRITWKAG